MDGYSKIEMAFRIRKDKMNDIRAMFAAIVMMEAAGRAEQWERILINMFKIDSKRRTFTNDKLGKTSYSPPLSTPTGIDLFCSRGPICLGENLIEWLFNIAAYLEDGFIEILVFADNVNFNGDAINTLYGYAVKDGNLYETVRHERFAIDLGANYILGRMIMSIKDDVRVTDSHYMKRFTY
ncbi:MAG: hypothetical protein P9M05_09145 [Candidatus Stygibacter australis]|nr:hypothetical protein [Candidatus Stygibacter australis]